ncbi:MAG: outer membrane beta-barrel protein [Planctomycetota bacterium]
MSCHGSSVVRVVIAALALTLLLGGGWRPVAAYGQIEGAEEAIEGSSELLEQAYASGELQVAAAAAPQPWTLPQPCFLQRMGVRMGGWVEQGITFNGAGRGDGFNGPVGLNDLVGEWQMNQLWLYFDRPLGNKNCGWGLGGHVDLVYGTDWRFGINEGLEDRINAFDRQTYGMVIPQAYMEVGYNRLSVKLGHFASPLLVYETVPSVANPFYSHSYAIAFSEPLLVTGVLADYKLTDQWTLFAGFHRGWMKFEDNNGAIDPTGGFRWLSPSQRTSMIYAVSSGPQDPAGIQDRFSHVFLMRQKIGERFEYIFQHDLGVEQNALPGGGSADWYGITQYFLRTINPQWTALARFEWFRDDDGVRVAGPPPQAGIRAWPGAPGFAGNFYELTIGLNWRPCPNLLLRPELRWDWYQGTPNSAGRQPFNDGQDDSQTLFATDLIVTY